MHSSEWHSAFGSCMLYECLVWKAISDHERTRQKIPRGKRKKIVPIVVDVLPPHREWWIGKSHELGQILSCLRLWRPIMVLWTVCSDFSQLASEVSPSEGASKRTDSVVGLTGRIAYLSSLYTVGLTSSATKCSWHRPTTAPHRQRTSRQSSPFYANEENYISKSLWEGPKRVGSKTTTKKNKDVFSSVAPETWTSVTRELFKRVTERERCQFRTLCINQ